jgi:23S rRNA pseudouridine955/2504/2580 synthase
MSGVQLIEISRQDDDLRFDRWAQKHFPTLGHGRLQKLLRTGQFRVDGGRAKANTRLKHGQTVRVPPLPEDDAAQPAQAKSRPVSDADKQFIRSLVIHEDERIVALNKPQGLAVQGGTGTIRHIDGMLEALSKRGEKPKLVHRLDRDTSGLLILARDARVARELSFAFQQHRVRKLYWAIVLKRPVRPEGVIDLALQKQGPAGKERMEAAHEQEGKFARTAYQTLAHAGRSASLLALLPLTGRTHQLRAHCAAMGNPILGDGKYGGKAALETNAPKGLMLHARELEFDIEGWPKTTLKADPPEHFIKALDWMGVESIDLPFARLKDWKNQLDRFD